jgi:RNA polymerase sigma factor (sigma-70 family)
MGICMRYCKGKEEAIEVVNDGFLKIYKELPNFTPRHQQFEASFKGWVKTIMVNTSIDHYRKNKKHAVVSGMEDSNTHQLTAEAEDAIHKLSFEEIIHTIQRLSPVYRTIFNLFVVEGYKHEEIAKLLGITVGTSKSNLSKAKANMQKMLREASKNYEQKAVG